MVDIYIYIVNGLINHMITGGTTLWGPAMVYVGMVTKNGDLTIKLISGSRPTWKKCESQLWFMIHDGIEHKQWFKSPEIGESMVYTRSKDHAIWLENHGKNDIFDTTKKGVKTWYLRVERDISTNRVTAIPPPPLDQTKISCHTDSLESVYHESKFGKLVAC